MKHAIVSLYQKNIEWCFKLLPFVDKVYIYDHDLASDITKRVCESNSKFIYEQLPFNKGSETSAYLKYIIDNYNELPDVMYFLHDEEYSWHHTGSIIDIIKNIDSTESISLNHYTWNNIMWRGDYLFETEQFDRFFEWYNRFFFKTFGDIRQLCAFREGRKGCAQFNLNPSHIHNCTKELYETLYAFCMYEDDGERIHGFGFFMEYFWNVLFGEVKTLSFIPKGSWKYISRYTSETNSSIHTELKIDGDWKDAIIPVKYEEDWQNHVSYIK